MGSNASTVLPSDPDARRQMIMSSIGGGERPASRTTVAPAMAKRHTPAQTLAPPTPTPATKPKRAYTRRQPVEPKPQTASTFLRNIAPETFARVRQLARQHRRTINAQWLWIVEEWLRQHDELHTA